MKKIFSFMLICLLVISTVLPTIETVSAAESIKYVDGKYDLPLTVLHESKDSESSMGRYVQNPSVTIKDGQATVSVTLTSSDMITSFQVETGGNLVDTTVESTNEADNTRVASFQVDDLAALLNAKVSIDTKSPFGVMNHGVRMQFDPSALPVVTPEEQPETPEVPEVTPEEQPETPEVPEVTPETPEVPEVPEVTPEEQPETPEVPEVTPEEQPETPETPEVPEVTPEEQPGTPEVPEVTPEEKPETPEVPEATPEEQPETPGTDDLKPTGKYVDGKYDLPLTVLHESKDSESSMGRYVQNPSVTIKDGQATVSVTLTSSDMITSFQVETGGNLVDTTVVSTNEIDNTRVASFQVDDLTALLNAKVSIDTKSPFGVMNHGVRLQFDPSALPVVTPEEQPETPEVTPEEKPETPETKPEEPKEETPGKSILEDGEYSINFRILHATKFEKSTMAGYVKTPALLSVKDGKNIVKFTLTDNEAITDFQVEQNGALRSAKVLSVHEAKNEREVEFEVEDLNSTVNANVQVQVKLANLDYTGNYDVRIAFEENSIQKKDGNKEPEQEGNPEQNVDNDQKPNTDQKPDKEKDQAQTSEKVDVKNLQDGKYSIGYKVLENNTNNTSMMNDYVVSPAQLTVKDGTKFIAITLKSSAWITDFQVEKGGQFITPKVVSTDSKADTRVVEFEVEDLFKKLNGKVSLDIPAYNYKTTHEVQIAFDTDSVKRLTDGEQSPKENGDVTTPPTTNPVAPTVPKGEATDGGLAFNRDADANESTNKTEVKSVDTKGTNPKTGDTTQILLFTLLLVGSLIPLVIKYRKRLVA